MTSRTPPCKNCEERHPKCHGQCKEYLDFVNLNEEDKKLRYHNSNYQNYLYDNRKHRKSETWRNVVKVRTTKFK